MKALNLVLMEDYIKAGREIWESGQVISYRVSSISYCLLVLSHHSPLVPQLSFHFYLYCHLTCSSSLVGWQPWLWYFSSSRDEEHLVFIIRETDFSSNQREQFSFLMFFRSIFWSLVVPLYSWYSASVRDLTCWPVQKLAWLHELCSYLIPTCCPHPSFTFFFLMK